MGGVAVKYVRDLTTGYDNEQVDNKPVGDTNENYSNSLNIQTIDSTVDLPLYPQMWFIFLEKN